MSLRRPSVAVLAAALALGAVETASARRPEPRASDRPRPPWDLRVDGRPARGVRADGPAPAFSWRREEFEPGPQTAFEIQIATDTAFERVVRARTVPGRRVARGVEGYEEYRLEERDALPPGLYWLRVRVRRTENEWSAYSSGSDSFYVMTVAETAYVWEPLRLQDTTTQRMFSPAAGETYAVRYLVEADTTAPIVVRIFDETGTIVRTLGPVEQGTGTHEQVWDGRNDAGDLVPAGAYTYQIVRADAPPDSRPGYAIDPGVRLDLAFLNEGNLLQHPSVVTLPDGRLRMYYGGFTAGGKWRIFSAVSTYGIEWTREGIRIDEPLGAANPEAVPLPDGRVRLYYEKYDGVRWQITSAISADGLAFMPEGGYRIPAGLHGFLDQRFTENPRVVVLDDGSLRMYYSGRGGDDKYRILSAVSADGLAWTSEPGVRIDLGAAGSIDDGFVSPGGVRRRPDGTLQMFYRGIRAPLVGNWIERILSAVSSDGLTWTKESGVVVDSSPEFGRGALQADVIDLADGTTRLYFGGFRVDGTILIFSALGSEVGTVEVAPPLDFEPIEARLEIEGGADATADREVGVEVCALGATAYRKPTEDSAAVDLQPPVALPGVVDGFADGVIPAETWVFGTRQTPLVARADEAAGRLLLTCRGSDVPGNEFTFLSTRPGLSGDYTLDLTFGVASAELASKIGAFVILAPCPPDRFPETIERVTVFAGMEKRPTGFVVTLRVATTTPDGRFNVRFDDARSFEIPSPPQRIRIAVAGDTHFRVFREGALLAEFDFAEMRGPVHAFLLSKANVAADSCIAYFDDVQFTQNCATETGVLADRGGVHEVFTRFEDADGDRTGVVSDTIVLVRILDPLRLQHLTPDTAVFDPSAGAFSIRYRVASSAPEPIVVRIFDETGALVRTLGPVEQGTGEHEQVWDGLDAAGDPVPPGSYTYQIVREGGRTLARPGFLRESGVRLDATSPLETDGVLGPSVVRLSDGRLRMYYSGLTRSPARTAVFSAVSSDGLVWTREGERFLVSTTTQGVVPSAIILDDSRTRLYYVNGDGTEIRSAISADGLAFTDEGTRLSVVAGGIEDVQITYPEVVRLPDGRWRIYYEGWNGSVGRILSAVSADGLTWTRETGVRIDVGPVGSFDARQALSPDVRRLPDGTWEMLYAGEAGGVARILRAVSTDGLTWTKVPGAVLEAVPAEGAGVFEPETIEWADGTRRVLYTGDGTPYRIFSALAGEVGTVEVVEPSCTPLPEGVVSWWRAEGDALDSLGSNNGTLRNGATFDTGRVGQAFFLDGVDDYVEVADAANLDLTRGITLEGWIWPATIVEGARIASKWASGDLGTAGYILHVTTGGRLRGALSSTGSDFQGVEAASPLQAAKWQHVAFTYDGAAMRLYLNGRLDGSVARTGPIFANIVPFLIGAQRNAGAFTDPTFSGKIDELSIYDRALSDTEIAALHAAGSAGKCLPNLVRLVASLVEADATDTASSRVRLRQSLVEGDAADTTSSRVRLRQSLVEADATDTASSRVRLRASLIEIDAGFPEIPSDTLAPTVRIDAPRGGETTSADTLDVRGAAFDLTSEGDTSNFKRYTLALAPADVFPPPFVVQVSNETPVESGTLGVIDLRGLSNGPYLVRLRAEDKSLNVAETTVRIELAKPLPDLVINDDAILLSDTNPDVGETVTVTVVVENAGTADAFDVEVALLRDGERVGTAFIPFLPFATSHETVVFEVVATKEGLTVLSGVADPRDLIAEQSELENMATRSLLVGEGFEGLILVEAVPDPEIVTSGGGLRILGTARYNPAYSAGGPVAGGCVEVFYQGLDPTSPLNEELREKVFKGRTLADGRFEVAVEAPLDSGTFTLAVTVTDHTVTGLRTTDFGVVAPTGPDLLVRTSGFNAVRDNFGILRGDQAVDVTFDTQPLDGGPAVTFTGLIWNVGRADAVDVEYRWRVGATTLEFDTVPLVAGNGGFASVSVTVPPAVLGAGGTFFGITLEADPSNLIPDEFREGNNAGTRTLYVYPAAFDRTPVRKR